MASPHSVHCYTNLPFNFSAVHAGKVCAENPSHCIYVAVVTIKEEKMVWLRTNQDLVNAFKRIHRFQNQLACLDFGSLYEVAVTVISVCFPSFANTIGRAVCTVFDQFGSRFRCCPGCCPNLWLSSGLRNAKGDAFQYFRVLWIDLNWICAAPYSILHTYPIHSYPIFFWKLRAIACLHRMSGSWLHCGGMFLNVRHLRKCVQSIQP